MTSFLLSTENWDGVLLCPPSFQVFGNFWPGSQCLSFVFFCVNYLCAWTLFNQDCDMLSLSYCAALSFHLRSRLPWAGIRYWYWYQFWILIVLYIDIGFRYWYCYDVLILKIDTLLLLWCVFPPPGELASELDIGFGYLYWYRYWYWYLIFWPPGELASAAHLKAHNPFSSLLGNGILAQFWDIIIWSERPSAKLPQIENTENP